MTLQASAAQQVAGPAPLIDDLFGVGFGFESCLQLLDTSYHPWAAHLQAVSHPLPSGEYVISVS